MRLRSSTAPIARCSAPCSRSVRPRSIQAPRAIVAVKPDRRPPGVRKDEEQKRRDERRGEQRTLAPAGHAGTPEERRK